jgi:signal transduction histidine kinase
MGIWPVACHHSVVGGSRRTATVWIGALALGAVGAGFGLLTLTEARSAPGLSFAGTSWVGAVAELTAGWALIAAGVAETWRRPASRAGLLLAGAGIGWFFVEWNNPGLSSPAAFTFGLIASALAAPLVAHAALAYPAGRLDSRLDVCVLVVAYAGAGLVQGLLPALFLDPGRQGCGLCPANLALVGSEPGLADGLQRVGLLLGVGWVVALVAVGVRRLRRASPPLRRMLWPVLAPAGCYLVLVGADFAHSLPRGTLGNDPLDHLLWLGQAALLVLMALGVSWAWVRDRRTRSAVVRLVMDAAQSPPPGGLRDVLAGMLDDPGLELAYPVGEPPRNVRADGLAAVAGPGGNETVTPLVRDGRTVALLQHRAGLLDDPGLVQEVAAAARLSMENERLHTEALAQLQDLQAAQARIVAGGDTERRRLERDLHDGAQQRLVALSLALRLASSPPGQAPAPRLTTLIGQADHELRLAIDELRELAHGIYPAVLADEGLAAAVEALAETSAIPITIGHLPQGRLPAPVEAAGYFLVAEASGLLAARPGAEGATVEAEHEGDRLAIQITSDAAPQPGQDLETALLDVTDRIGALGGRLSAAYVPGGAITIRAEIPCGS